MASMIAKMPVGREGCLQKKRQLTTDGADGQHIDENVANRAKRQRQVPPVHESGVAKSTKILRFPIKYEQHDCADYAESIFAQKFAIEKQFVLKDPVFASKQWEIDGSVYLRLIAVFFAVSQDQSLDFSTLLLSIQIFDQVLSKFQVPKKSALLVCAACLTLASKLEEIYPVDVEKLQEITEYAFTREELFSMEKHLLMKLDYRLAMPTRDQFALYYSRHFHFTSRQQQLLSFLILLSFLDYNFNYICMSQVAAAASLLVLQMTQATRFSDASFRKSFEHITEYSFGELIEPLLRLRKVHESRYEFPHIQSILEYYSTVAKEEVNILYDAINFNDLNLGENTVLPAQEKDFAFVERALETAPAMVSTRKAEQDRRRVSELPTFQQQLKLVSGKVKISKPTR